MNVRAYRRFLSRYGVTQGHAAAMLADATTRSGARWAAEGPPFTVEMLLRLIQYYELPIDEIEKLSKDVKKRREHEQSAV